MTEFTRSIKLLNQLKNDDEAREHFQDNPDEVLREFGIEGEEGDRFKNRFEDGELRVLGWRLGASIGVLSPWPMTESNRVLRRVSPNPIRRNEETEIEIVGSGFKPGDRVGFRLQGGEVEVEAHEVEIAASNLVRAKVRTATEGTYDVVVGRMAGAGFLNGGLTVE